MKKCLHCGKNIPDEAIKCEHCGEIPAGNRAGVSTQDLHHDGEIEPGMILAERFEIVARIDSSRINQTYKAVDKEEGGSEVAIEILHPELAQNKRSITALRQAGTLWVRLDHPNICRLHHFFAEADLKFLVTGYIQGQTLEGLLDDMEDRTLSVGELLPIARQIGEALDYAHGRRPPVLHGDIEPTNIMIASNRNVKVTGFGTARQVKDLTATVAGRQAPGTLVYMSPEQYSGARPTPASDIYSFAATLYECLSGRPPFSSGSINYQLLNVTPEEILGLPRHVNAALLSGLAKEPTARPASALQLVKMIADAASADVMEGAAAAKEPEVAEPADTSIRTVYVYPGKFLMGSPPDEEIHFDDEVQHSVRLTRGLYTGVTQVTQVQWTAVMENNPSYIKGDDLPVHRVTWFDALEFCEKLGEKEGRKYRLPTEAEWEYACRAGTSGPYSTGANTRTMAWYRDNSDGRVRPVATKLPNAWGIYDMHGNVWEWCSDWYGEYSTADLTDPTGPETGTCRVIRGGARRGLAGMCRSAFRGSDPPESRHRGVGFRVVIDIE